MTCHDGVEVVAKSSLFCRWLLVIVGGGWLAVIPVLSLYRRRNAGCDKLSEVTQHGPVESASSSVDQDGLCFTVKAFD